jgi:hypothetical protein
MKHLRRLFAICALLACLSGVALAGDTQGPGMPQPQPPCPTVSAGGPIVPSGVIGALVAWLAPLVTGLAGSNL